MSTKKRIAFFTKYTADDAVSRNRFYTDKTMLNQQGFEIMHCPFYNASASKAWYEKGLQPGAFTTLFARLRRWYQLMLYKENTIAVIEYPLLPGASFSFQKKWLDGQKKVVIDVTDSEAKNDKVFLEIIPLADAVITTTLSITRQLLPIAKELTTIPFSISVKEYNNIRAAQQPSAERTPFRIGWLGNQSTSKQLLLLKDCFLQLHDLYNIQIVLIGFDEAKKAELKDLPFVNHKRDEGSDISILKACDVGVLPLPDNVNNFPFQMIQYMACGLPVVASSCEATIAINHGNDNFIARSIFEWYSCLAAMIQNQDFYKEVGERNKSIVNDFYSTDKTGKDYLSLVLNINDDSL